MIRNRQPLVRVLMVLFGVALANFAAANDAWAQEITLRVGDVAPSLSGTKWIKGDPVVSFEPGKFYVVDFWATWCRPCRETFPMLARLQDRYASKGLVIIGQSTWEQDDNTMQPFLGEMGSKINFRLAADTDTGDQGAIGRAWMTASQHTRLPCDFLVDQNGKVVWIGSTDHLEPILEKFVAGTLDPQKEADAQHAREDFDLKLTTLASGNKPHAALTLLQKYETDHPEASDELAFEKFKLLLANKKFDEASKAGATAIKYHHNHPDMLHKIAWAIVGDNELEKRDTALALQAANRANELTGGSEPEAIDTIARCYFFAGDYKKAMELERQAISRSSGTRKDDLSETLKWFQENAGDEADQASSSDKSK